MFRYLEDAFETQLLSRSETGKLLRAWREHFGVEKLDFEEFRDSFSRHDRFFNRKALSRLNTVSSKDFYVYGDRVPALGAVRCRGPETSGQALYDLHLNDLCHETRVFDAEFQWCWYYNSELGLVLAA